MEIKWHKDSIDLWTSLSWSRPSVWQNFSIKWYFGSVGADNCRNHPVKSGHLCYCTALRTLWLWAWSVIFLGSCDAMWTCECAFAMKIWQIRSNIWLFFKCTNESKLFIFVLVRILTYIDSYDFIEHKFVFWHWSDYSCLFQLLDRFVILCQFSAMDLKAS